MKFSRSSLTTPPKRRAVLIFDFYTQQLSYWDALSYSRVTELFSREGAAKLKLISAIALMITALTQMPIACGI